MYLNKTISNIELSCSILEYNSGKRRTIGLTFVTSTNNFCNWKDLITDAWCVWVVKVIWGHIDKFPQTLRASINKSNVFDASTNYDTFKNPIGSIHCGTMLDVIIFQHLDLFHSWPELARTLDSIGAFQWHLINFFDRTHFLIGLKTYDCFWDISRTHLWRFQPSIPWQRHKWWWNYYSCG